MGGGLAGLAAALELVDRGHDVVLHEARPTLGGAVQTLPERDGDPPPPPDNGQHIALGCFESYLAFLDRIGSLGSVRRLPLQLPVIDERGRVATIGYGLVPLLRYRHLPLRDRVRILALLARLPRLDERHLVSFVHELERRRQPGQPAADHDRPHRRSPEPTIRSFWSGERRGGPAKTSNPAASIRSRVAR